MSKEDSNTKTDDNEYVSDINKSKDSKTSDTIKTVTNDNELEIKPQDKPNDEEIVKQNNNSNKDSSPNNPQSPVDEISNDSNEPNLKETEKLSISPTNTENKNNITLESTAQQPLDFIQEMDQQIDQQIVQQIDNNIINNENRGQIFNGVLIVFGIILAILGSLVFIHII
jgi:hypothetical protein